MKISYFCTGCLYFVFFTQNLDLPLSSIYIFVLGAEDQASHQINPGYTFEEPGEKLSCPGQYWRSRVLQGNGKIGNAMVKKPKVKYEIGFFMVKASI